MKRFLPCLGALIVSADVLSGCSGDKGFGAFDPNAAIDGHDVPNGTVRADIFPSGGPQNLLPQTFVLVPDGAVYADASLQLSPTAILSGTLTGEVIHGWGGAPTTPEAVIGSLDAIIDENHLQGAATRVEVDTNGDASFSLSLPTAPNYAVRIVPADATATPFSLAMTEVVGDADWSQVIAPGAPLYGRVTDHDGNHLAGVPLRIRRADGTVVSSEFSTDAGGWYVARVLPGFDYIVQTVSDAGSGSVLVASVDVPVTVEDENGASVSIDVGSVSDALLTGRVVDDVTGQPVSQASVHAVSTSLDDSTGVVDVAVTIQDDGNFAVHLLPGTYTLDVVPPSDRRTATPAHLSRVVIGLDGLPLGDVRLEGPRKLSGTVFTEEGATVGKATLNATQLGGGGFVFSTTTDDNGNYSFSELPNSAFDLEVSPYNPDSGAVEHQPISAGATSADVMLRAGVDVTGTVYDPDGVGVAYALVELRDYVTKQLLARTLSGEDGVFRVRIDADAMIHEDDTGTDTGGGDSGDSTDTGGADTAADTGAADTGV